MRGSRVAGAVVFLAVLGNASPARAQTTTRASVSAIGEQANLPSGGPAMSLGGRFVAFASSASNLVPGDTNGFSDIFVRDRQTGAIALRSVASDGSPANLPSFSPAVSTDGRHVAFTSFASNLVPGDTNGNYDVFVNDRQTGLTARISVSPSGGEFSGPSSTPSISADGRFIAFHQGDVYLRDRDTDGDGVFDEPDAAATFLLSVGLLGAPADGPSFNASISTSGRYVAFSSYATNLVPDDTNLCDLNDPKGAHPCRDVFVTDRQTGAIRRVSVSAAGAQADEDSFDPSISGDGRFVAFTTQASNLVPEDASFTSKIVLLDRDADGDGDYDPPGAISTRLVSIGLGGAPANDESSDCSISSDGRLVAFQSRASNLVAGDTNTCNPELKGTPPCGDIFVHDCQTGATTRVSVSSAGDEANDESRAPSMSGDGRFIAFESRATNLVLRDTNTFDDVFVHDRKACRAGSVNGLTGPVTNVLFVNGSAGTPETRVVTVGRRQPITVSLDAAPAGPNPDHYALWLWRGLPFEQFDLFVSGQLLGCTVSPSPLRTSAPQPFKCLLGGLGPEYCGSGAQLPAPPQAPWMTTRPRGLRGGTFTLQAVIEDLGAANSIGLSVTNAIVMVIQ